MGLPLEINPEKKAFDLYDDVDYKVFWSGWQQSKLDQAEHAIVKALLPHSGTRLIDIGCGYGRLADCYLDRYQQVVMLDGSFSLLREAQENTQGRAIYIAGDLHHLPFHVASFDSLVFVRVFHHVIDSQACLEELHRVLARGGKLVFSFRNKLYLIAVIKWLAKRTTDSPFSLQPSGVGTTLISHHPNQIKGLLQKTGFSDLQYRGLGALDRIADKMGEFGKYAPTGQQFAPLLGKLNIAPWMFCAATATTNSPLLTNRHLDELLACPVCNVNLQNGAGGYTCISCGRCYPIIDGIIDFRILT